MRIVAASRDLPGTAEGRPPGEFRIFPHGQIDIEGQAPAVLDDAAAAAILAAFERRGNDMVIDYEHQTLQDVQAPAAGWIRRLTWKGREGLWAVVEWTQKAAAYLQNREYRYFSPVLKLDKDRRVVQLLNVALTNSPLMNHVRPIVAKMDHEETERAEIPGDPSAVLAAKTQALLDDPVRGPGLSYGDAMNIVARENPELATSYLLGPVQSLKSRKQIVKEASDMLCLKIKDLLDDPVRGRGLSAGEAMSIVAKENPGLTRRYLTGNL